MCRILTMIPKIDKLTDISTKESRAQMFFTMHQSAATESEDAPDLQQFLNWKGKAAAEVLLHRQQSKVF